MNEDLDYISEEDLMAELERPDISAEDSLIYMKMLCTKRGMTNSIWEEIFGEQKRKQTLRQYGVSEDIITKIIASLARPRFSGINQIHDFLSFDDERRELKCSYPMCPKKPYNVATVTREKPGSGIIDAIVVVLCKEHFTIIETVDIEAGKLGETIAEAATKKWTKGM
jgi:hypothetical protein